MASANEVFLEKIQNIKNMARSTPLKADREEEKEAGYQPTYNGRFQGPLDRVVEMREGQDDEEERGAIRSIKVEAEHYQK